MRAIHEGLMQFTIDQQPFLQGFQTVMQLYLLKQYQLAPTDVNTGVAPSHRRQCRSSDELARTRLPVIDAPTGVAPVAVG